MKKIRTILQLSLAAIIFSSCKKDDAPEATGFDDNFESYAQASDLFTGTNWSYYEQTYIENTLSISHDTVHGDTSAVRFYSKNGTTATVSKSGLASHGKVAFHEGDVVRFSAWYYFPQNEGLDKVLILDIEDPAAISSGPGIRLMFDPDNALMVERNKMQLSNLTQKEGSKVAFPLNQWVHVEFELKMSTKKRGYVKLFQDGNLLIDEDGVATMPRDQLYLTQGTHKFYTNIEAGITANNSGHDIILFMDDFSIQKIN